MLGISLGGSNLNSIARGIVNAFSGDIFVQSDQTCYTTDARTVLATKDQAVGGINGLLGRYYATQATAGYRPVLRKGEENDLLYSEQIDNAAWQKSGLLAFGAGSVANATTAPDGTMTADLLVEDTTNGQHIVFQQFIGQSAIERTAGIKLKYHSRRYVSFRYDDGNAPYCVVDLQTGAVVAGSGISSTDEGNGWYLYRTTKTPPAGSHYISVDFMPGAAIVPFSYIGDGVSGVYVWGAQRAVGAQLGTYVKTEGSVVSNGIGPSYLDVAGTDDRLEFSAVPFQMADDHFFVIAVKVLSKATTQTLFSIGSTASNTQRIECGVNATTGYVYASWIDDAATTATITGSTDVVGSIVIISGVKQGNNKRLRVNGVQIGATNTTAMGAATFTTARKFCTAILTPTNFSTCYEYCMKLGVGTISDAQLSLIERYAAAKAGTAI